ncbi:MAG: NTP transferase domain-containing protein [Roseiflexaceae bacterium]
MTAVPLERHDTTVVAVILAAGLSRRLGRSKQLLPWRGTTLLGYTIDVVRAAGISDIAVVLGHDAAAVRTALADRAVVFLENADYAMGQGTSVACGARWAQQRGCRRVVFLPCDQPLLTATHLQTLLAAHPSAAACMPRVGQQPTSPVVWGAQTLEILSQLSGPTGGRQLFAAGTVVPTYVDFDAPELLRDIDTPEDYAALCDM